MKWLIGVFVVYVIFSSYYIQSLDNDNKVFAANNAVLNNTVEEQNKTIERLFKLQNSQLEVLQNLDKEKDKITRKYEGLRDVISSENNTTLIDDFNVIVDRLWE